jgi:hypothetical protein
MHRPLSMSAVLTLALELSACGLYTPNIQEFWANNDQATLRENDLVRLIRCETGIAIQRAFNGEIAPTYEPSPGHPPPKINLDWFESWGVAVSLTMTVVENSAVNPGVTATNVLQNAVTKFPINGNVTTPQNFVLAVGGTLSSTATTTDKLLLFYKVSELKNAYFAKDAVGKYFPCTPPTTAGTLFAEDNFKIFDWLERTLFLQYTQVTNFEQNNLGPQGQNGVSHEVKFEIVTNGNVTPTWKFVNISNVPSNPFFATGRDRTQDLIITIGPMAKPPTGQPPQLSTAALNADFILQLAAAIAAASQGTQ